MHEKLESFQNRLERNWNSRHKELICHSQLLGMAEDEGQTALLTRMGIVLLYLYWEGFIKDTFRDYIALFRHSSVCTLPKSVLSLLLLGFMQKNQLHKPCFSNIEKLVGFMASQEAHPNIEPKDCFNFESNLRFMLFSSIIASLEGDAGEFSTKEKFIDENFVTIRHEIAHGGRRPIQKEEFLKVKEEVLAIMGRYKDILLNAALCQERCICGDEDVQPETALPT